MKCIKCNQVIPEGRLKILPETKTCVACSDTSRWYVRNVTTAEGDHLDVEIVKDPAAAAVMRSADTNIGWNSNLDKLK